MYIQILLYNFYLHASHAGKAGINLVMFVCVQKLKNYSRELIQYGSNNSVAFNLDLET